MQAAILPVHRATTIVVLPLLASPRLTLVNACVGIAVVAKLASDT